MAAEDGQPDGPEREENIKIAALCERNIETALARLPLCSETSYDMVLALLLGVRPSAGQRVVCNPD